jgi:hypothetical protein
MNTMRFAKLAGFPCVALLADTTGTQRLPLPFQKVVFDFLK